MGALEALPGKFFRRSVDTYTIRCCVELARKLLRTSPTYCFIDMQLGMNMRIFRNLAVFGGVMLLAGCTMTMGPSGQGTAATSVQEPEVETRIDRRPVPVVERRSAIRATGYAVISVQSSDIAAQQRLLAIRASNLTRTVA